MKIRSAALILSALCAATNAWSHPEAEPGKSEDGRVVTLGKSKLTFYGFLRLDVVYDSDRPNNAQIPGFILSPDLNPPQGPAAGKSDLTMHPRLTRVGLDLEGPNVKELS